MPLSKQAIREFKTIYKKDYKKEFGKELGLRQSRQAFAVVQDDL